jgi:putative membrane protein
MAGFVPYCGTSPVPGTLHWTHAPILTALLVVAPLAWFLRPRNRAVGSARAFAAGWLLVSLCFLSPLCNLGVALFSARAAQHVVLTLAVAPLLAVAWGGRRPASSTLRLATSNALFMATLWLWHSPAFYDATLQDNVVYWTMICTVVAAAVWLWREIGAADGLQALAGVSFAGAQMCALGAFIVFAARPLYAVHAGTTWAWGLTPLQDQSLGGLIMWTPGSLLVAGYSGATLWVWLNRLAALRARGAVAATK